MTEKYQPIPHRLKNMAVGGHVAGAEDIDAGNGKTQQEINADTYRKSETYSKEQLDSMITTPDQEYKSVVATSSTATLADIAALIATKYPDDKEKADTIYRVGNWDGTQYNTGAYSEYTWDGENYVFMSKKEPGIDDKPTVGSDNLVKSGGVIGTKVNNNLRLSGASNSDFYIGALVDSSGKLVPNDYRRCTELVKVYEGDTFLCELTNSSGYSVVAYDKDFNIIPNRCVSGTIQGSYTVLSTESYLRFVANKGGTSVASVVLSDALKETFRNYINAASNSDMTDITSSVDKITLSVDGIEKDLLSFENFPERNYWLAAGGEWSGNGKHKVIPVSNAQTLFVEINNDNFCIAFLQSYTEPTTTTSTLDYCEGQTGPIYINKSTSGSYSIPEDCKYILVDIEFANEDRSPKTLKIDGVDLKTPTFSKIKNLEDKTQTLENNIHTFESSVDSIDYNYLTYLKDAIYTDYIKELYIYDSYLNGIDKVYLLYNRRLAIQARDSNGVNIWSIDDYSALSENKIHNLVCTTAGGSASVGDIVGYIIFGKLPLPTYSIVGDNSRLDLDKITNLKVNVEICSFLAFKDPAEGVDIILPNNIYAVVGDTLQLYYRSIVKCTNPYNYSISVVSDYGRCYPRYYEIKPTATQVGTKNLTIKVISNANTVIKEKTVNLVIVPTISSPISKKNILLIGDSIYADGVATAEINRRLTGNDGAGTPINPRGLGLTNIGFIGRRYVNGIHQEANGGYGWSTYCTDAFKDIRFYVTGVSQLAYDDVYKIDGVAISATYTLKIKEINVTDGVGNILCEVYGGYIYPSGVIPASGTLTKKVGSGDATITYTSFMTEDGNPFWDSDNNRIDFQLYSQLYCNSASIDAIITNLGINSIRTIADATTNIEDYIKPFIRRYHEQYPNGKFFIGGMQLWDIRGGIGANQGAKAQYYWYNIACSYWNYIEKLKELVADSEFSSYVFLVNTTGEFDCEYSYPYNEVQVNNRIAETEPLGSNSQHPTSNGRLLLSDSFYRIINGVGL